MSRFALSKKRRWKEKRAAIWFELESFKNEMRKKDDEMK
jgi:hypothetical protein